MKKRTIALMMAVVMIFGVAIGSTIAWLTSKSNDVVNTFTVGDVKIELYETEPGSSSDSSSVSVNSREFQLVPGNTYTKDPIVKVIRPDTNVDCWLFVKFDELYGASSYLTYDSTLDNGGWTQGDGTNIPRNVWYRKVFKDDQTISWYLLANNTVTVKNTVVKAGTDVSSNSNLSPMPTDSTKLPQLVWTAYAAQSDNLSAIDAWKLF